MLQGDACLVFASDDNPRTDKLSTVNPKGCRQWDRRTGKRWSRDNPDNPVDLLIKNAEKPRVCSVTRVEPLIQRLARRRNGVKLRFESFRKNTLDIKTLLMLANLQRFRHTLTPVQGRTGLQTSEAGMNKPEGSGFIWKITSIDMNGKPLRLYQAFSIQAF